MAKKKLNKRKRIANRFDTGGTANIPMAGIPGLNGLDLSSIGALGSGSAAGNIAGTGDIVNTLTGGQKLQASLGLGTGSLGKGLSSGSMNGLANTAASAIGSAINPSGNSTAVGDVMQTVGSIASNIPGIGGLIGAGVNLVGGLVNAAFGSNINEEFVEQTREETDAQRAYTSNANDNASLLSDWSSYADKEHVKRSDVGTDGWFRNKAKNLTKELNKNIDQANNIATQNLTRASKRVDRTNDNLIRSSFYSYGGFLPTSAIGYDLATTDLSNDTLKAASNFNFKSLPNSFSTVNTFDNGGEVNGNRYGTPIVDFEAINRSVDNNNRAFSSRRRDLYKTQPQGNWYRDLESKVSENPYFKVAMGIGDLTPVGSLIGLMDFANSLDHTLSTGHTPSGILDLAIDGLGILPGAKSIKGLSNVFSGKTAKWISDFADRAYYQTREGKEEARKALDEIRKTANDVKKNPFASSNNEKLKGIDRKLDVIGSTIDDKLPSLYYDGVGGIRGFNTINDVYGTNNALQDIFDSLTDKNTYADGGEVNGNNRIVPIVNFDDINNSVDKSVDRGQGIYPLKRLESRNIRNIRDLFPEDKTYDFLYGATEMFTPLGPLLGISDVSADIDNIINSPTVTKDALVDLGLDALGMLPGYKDIRRLGYLIPDKVGKKLLKFSDDLFFGTEKRGKKKVKQGLKDAEKSLDDISRTSLDIALDRDIKEATKKAFLNRERAKGVKGKLSELESYTNPNIFLYHNLQNFGSKADGFNDALGVFDSGLSTWNDYITNQFDNGGDKKEGKLSDSDYIGIMEKVAEDNYKNWGFDTPDEALTYALNDNTYNYRAYYDKYPNSNADSFTHWTDEFKTVWHPTFSNESLYSGNKSQYNPKGLEGGTWYGDIFNPAPWQPYPWIYIGNNFAKGGELSNSNYNGSNNNFNNGSADNGNYPLLDMAHDGSTLFADGGSTEMDRQNQSQANTFIGGLGETLGIPPEVGDLVSMGVSFTPLNVVSGLFDLGRDSYDKYSGRRDVGTSDIIFDLVGLLPGAKALKFGSKALKGAGLTKAASTVGKAANQVERNTVNGIREATKRISETAGNAYDAATKAALSRQVDIFRNASRAREYSKAVKAVADDAYNTMGTNAFRYNLLRNGLITANDMNDSGEAIGNMIDYVDENLFSKGGGIHIKKKNKGKFTDYCGGKVTSECIARGKRSSNPTTRKRATFAANARKWKHAFGGTLNTSLPDTTQDAMDKLTEQNSNFSGNPSNIIAQWSNSSLLTGDDIKEEGGLNDAKFILNKKRGNKVATKAAEEANKAIVRNMTSAANNANNSVSSNAAGSFYANGGPFTHGGIFSNGITEINEGGTHEENKYEGVQLGVDGEGIPNLVEEGEVVFNDYVFSNRMKLPKDMKQKYKLRGTTYADAAKYASKESEERPNDPISKRGLDSIMQTLAYSQENERMKKEMKKANRYARGGKLGKLFDGTGTSPNSLDFSDLWYNGLPFVTSLQEEDASALRNYSYPNPVINDTTTTGTVNNTDNTPSLDGNTNSKGRGINSSYLRYAPALMSAVSAFSDIFTDPDYSAADRIASVDIRPNLVYSTPVGQKLRYTPFDKNYYLNKLARSSAATRRGVMDSSGGNRAAMLSGLLASNYSFNEGLGSLARQAEEYNNNLRKEVADFNRVTDIQNASSSLQAQMANAQARANAAQQRLVQAEAVAKYRQAAKDAYDARRSANLNSFINNLGDIGRETYQMNILNSNPALYYSLSNLGNVGYKGAGTTNTTTKAKGGKIKRRRII